MLWQGMPCEDMFSEIPFRLCLMGAVWAGKHGLLAALEPKMLGQVGFVPIDFAALFARKTASHFRHWSSALTSIAEAIVLS